MIRLLLHGAGTWFKLLSQHTALKPSGSQEGQTTVQWALHTVPHSTKLLQTNPAPSALCGQWSYCACLWKGKDLFQDLQTRSFPSLWLCSRLPHQREMPLCKGRSSLALSKCPSHFWILALQKCMQEKYRPEKPRSALPSFPKERQQSFWINWRRARGTLQGCNMVVYIHADFPTA